MDKVDVTSIGINERLARKYNAIVNFINKDTVYVDGCLNDLIVDVEYVRENSKELTFHTKDYIKITTGTFNKTLWVNNPKSLSLDRKYNFIVKVGYLEV